MLINLLNEITDEKVDTKRIYVESDPKLLNELIGQIWIQNN